MPNKQDLDVTEVGDFMSSPSFLPMSGKRLKRNRVSRNRRLE